jgi:hypothetical protein
MMKLDKTASSYNIREIKLRKIILGRGKHIASIA